MAQSLRKPAPRRNHYHADMLSVEEARERILSYFSVLPAVERPLLECLGMVLAEDLIAGASKLQASVEDVQRLLERCGFEGRAVGNRVYQRSGTMRKRRRPSMR